ncbi:hypothetical protein A3A93_02855 [Candidatus Roizmanbacteria bacterium RIFCSPLOWO2_01_FULL_38_12]|uniref:Nudix hydrolase domain-containing protein n=1 Tax=Candidatus Roizmanbacteria bacterium RIFCSPLOWO2_01_FULL_38_12 TaxID=1802061 RepID=A0A1F7IVK5_9BACT|nr:MAG: hypothetical protein A3F59_03515 [Candidatus Roizmanbacteria bacterium RIFCSPHIGHO2_12_FULL_38_13]OGK47391.1 MAG: hypothetical protein A3A93_02855 [Candidatus Roizmanbacteria bacterium RIFCSPLOWO2_01_FULL_38_12]
MDYFDQLQYIAKVDKNDKVIGKIERWQAHKKGILHRGFTLAVFYKNKIVLQHRKHPVFDGVFDATISSHQIFENEKLEDDISAIYKTLDREWNIGEENLDAKPKYVGKIYYQATDPRSDFKEHEICRIFSCSLKNLKLPNFEFAYGLIVKPLNEIKNPKNPLYPLLAPWVIKAFPQISGSAAS